MQVFVSVKITILIFGKTKLFNIRNLMKFVSKEWSIKSIQVQYFNDLSLPPLPK